MSLCGQMLLDKLQGRAVPQLWDAHTLCDVTTPSSSPGSADADAIQPFINRKFSPPFHSFTDTCLQLDPAKRYSRIVFVCATGSL